MASPDVVPEKMEENTTTESKKSGSKQNGGEVKGDQQPDSDSDDNGNNDRLSTNSISRQEGEEEDDTVTETTTPIESSTTPAPSSVATSNVTAEEDEEEEDEEIKPKFYVTQRVYGRDEPTGLLYEAVVRRVMKGPRSRQINVHLLSKEEAERLQENNNKIKNGESADPDLGFVLDDFDEGAECWHYFVHYMGWNVKWDRWVEESSLYEDTEGAKILADKLKAEM
eukprot:3365625-Ditylum_brightwellii.AAC.1